MTRRHRHRLPFGAELVAPDRTRFRLWAPSASAVSLVVHPAPSSAASDDADDEHPMVASDDGWFELETGHAAGTWYRYRVTPHDGDALLVPDPASRLQSRDVHEPSVVVDPEAYAWRNDAWHGRPWRETVIYELHVGLAGGFVAMRRLLAPLAALGVTAIELMPIADFAGDRNWGYDGVLPFAPDTTYGTPDELKAFVDDAHGHGLMVFLDVVYNHFGPDGNYLGAYAEPFFRDDIETPWGRAIDFRRREVREFFENNVLYWLDEYRFDGLRLDATHAIVPQDWLDGLRDVVRNAIDASRHVHLVIEHEGNAARLLGPHGPFDAQWNDDLHHCAHVLLTGEHEGYYGDFAAGSVDKLATSLAEGFVYQGQPSAFKDGEARGEPSIGLPMTAFVSCLQNHDQIGNRAFGDRLATLADPHALRAASAMLLLCPHIPLLFMGEEWGETRPFLFFTGFTSDELAAAVREGRRNEFSWLKHFADPATRETIPDPNALATYDRSRPDFACLVDRTGTREAESWLRHTAHLLAIRREAIAPFLDTATSLGAEAIGPAAVVARWRLADANGPHAVLTIVANLGADAVPLDAARHPLEGRVLHATPSTPGEVREGFVPPCTTWAFLATGG